MMKLLCVTFALACASPAFSQTPATVAAPPLRFLQNAPARDLGLWDDVFVADERDDLILRRGKRLFVLPAKATETEATETEATETEAIPRQLLDLPELNNSSIIAGWSAGQSLWLLVQPHADLPFAIEVYSGKIARFPLPKPKAPSPQNATVQSYLISPQATAIIEVSGGDPKSWPRPENRPLYFWLDLKSGRVVAFPIGWDLYFLSADQSTASFGGAKTDANGNRRGYAVDLATAKTVGEMPDRKERIFVSFNWSDTNRTKILVKYRDGDGERGYFAGVSTGQDFYTMNVDLEQPYSLRAAQTNGNYVAFELQRPATSFDESDERHLYLSDLESRAPQLVTDKSSDYELLGGGNLVYSENGYGHLKRSSATYFFDAARQKRWDVLEGSDRLLALAPEFADKNYVRDKLSARFFPSFGASNDLALLLCQFQQTRLDERALPAFQAAKEPKLEHANWQRTLILSSGGQRYMTSLFRDEQPDRLWLHASGALFAGTNVWGNNGERAQIRLSRTQLNLG